MNDNSKSWYTLKTITDNTEDGQVQIDGYFTCTDKFITEAVIPNGAVIIGQSAFEGCQFLRRVVIPEGVKQIE